MFKVMPLLGLVLALGLVACQRQGLTVATTTSAYDSGLLGALILPFEKGHRVKVKVVAVGSGQAITLGQRGDADVLLTHSPELEEEFMAQGYGVRRQRVMANDFVLLGPPQDPAGVRGGRDAVAALGRIALIGALFVSRGDDSGTHRLEQELWSLTGAAPEGQSWYLSVGQGMGETLTLADEKGAYTIADRGTYLARQGGLKLKVLVEGDEKLLNLYSVIAVNPARHPPGKLRLAEEFIDYLTSPEAQGLIAQFGREKYGQPLFLPAAQGG